MPNPAVAVVATTVASTAVQAKSSRDATKKQKAAADKATDTQLKMFHEASALLQPFVGGGEAAFNAYLGDIGVPGFKEYATGNLPKIMSPDEYAKSAELKFGQQQGLEAIESSAAARGGVLSGQAVRESQVFGQEYGLSKYEQYRSRAVGEQQRYLQNLFGAAQIGQASAAKTGAFGVQTGSGIAQTQIAAGKAQAAGILGQGQAISSGIENIGSIYSFGAGGGFKGGNVGGGFFGG